MKATKEQIKEAFRKTIERWKEITRNVKYFDESTCSLCKLENMPGDMDMNCNNSCPIQRYKGEDHFCCVNTPYGNFYEERDYESALVELNFLREVYLDFLEDEIQGLLDEIDKGIKEEEEDSTWVKNIEVKEEKKEEWVDVTEKLYLSFHKHFNGGYDIHFSRNSDREVGKDWIGWVYSDGRFEIAGDERENYKIEKVDNCTFRILERVRK